MLNIPVLVNLRNLDVSGLCGPMQTDIESVLVSELFRTPGTEYFFNAQFEIVGIWNIGF